jgi:hypothetical protein
MRRPDGLGFGGWQHVQFYLPLVAALGACAAQVDPEYQGEPIATMRGTVVAPQALETDKAVSAAIVWTADTWFPDGVYKPKFIGTRFGVTGSFPARFTLDLYTAPSFEPESDYKMYVGYLAAVASNAPDSDIAARDILGIDTNHILLYFVNDTPSYESLITDSTLSENKRQVLSTRISAPVAFNVSGDKGYHLAKLNPVVKERRHTSDECSWDGLCVHKISPSGLDTDDFETEFERCTEAFPQNPSCSAWVYTLRDASPDGSIIPRADEPDWSTACNEQRAALVVPGSCDWDGSELENGSLYSDNRRGLADPITIEMGKAIWDFGR